MKKHIVELSMAVLLLLGVYFLSREGALLVNKEETKDRIVIDAGHGGADPGVVGVNQLKEKDINLAIAKELRKLLQEQGYSVVMTRTKDEGLYQTDTVNKKVEDMQKRCAIIEEKQPILTVSIHQNSYQQPQVCGPQVFYYTHSVEGQKLAKFIQEKLNMDLEVEKPRIEKANATYYLLKKSKGTLAIVESGFLTNEREAKLLETKEYQKKVARAVCDGIVNYLNYHTKV